MHTPLLQQIADACRHAEAITDIYAKLRARQVPHSRTSLLRNAESYADEINIRLGTIAKLAGDSPPNAEFVAAMHELGALMEQVMIQEREYRISMGGDPSPLSLQHDGNQVCQP